MNPGRSGLCERLPRGTSGDALRALEGPASFIRKVSYLVVSRLVKMLGEIAKITRSLVKIAKVLLKTPKI